MKLLFIILLACVVASCANPNAKLVGNTSNIYGGIGQTVSGDSKSVTIWNIWSAKDAKPVAEQHCKKYGKTVVSMSFIGITGYYECGSDNNSITASEILSKTDVKIDVSNVTNCIRKNVVVLDDLQSDAKSIAEAVSQICGGKFQKFAESFISHIKDSEYWELDKTNNIKNILINGQAKQTLPFVLIWRSLIRKGWDKNKEPSKEQLPDDLFEITI
jgi:hypothetical protein